MVDGHLVPVLGKVRLDKLAPADVRRLHAARRDTLKPAGLVKVHAVLRAALSDAERMDLVGRNVAKVVSAPSQRGRQRQSSSAPDVRRFLEAAADDRLEALFVLALTMGLRRGELLGLRWDDVDFDAKALLVCHSVQRIHGSLQLVQPKTEGSRRPLPIPAAALAALRRQQTRQDEERTRASEAWQEHGLVFASTVGTLMEPRNVTRRVQQLRDKADLPGLRLHDFRHACATLLQIGRVASDATFDSFCDCAVAARFAPARSA